MVTASWYSDTSRPRCLAGAISLMYAGATTAEMPMPTPPTMRNRTSDANELLMAHPAAETVYRTDAMISDRFLPPPSKSSPELTTPAIEPISAHPT